MAASHVLSSTLTKDYVSFLVIFNFPILQELKNECEIPYIRSLGPPTREIAEIGTIKNETLPSRFPTFHARWVSFIQIKLFLSTFNSKFSHLLFIECSEQGPWSAMISYEACVRLCLHSWETDSVTEASYFLNDDCTLIRNAFGWETCFGVWFCSDLCALTRCLILRENLVCRISSFNLKKNCWEIDLLAWLLRQLLQNSREVLEKLNSKVYFPFCLPFSSLLIFSYDLKCVAQQLVGSKWD